MSISTFICIFMSLKETIFAKTLCRTDDGLMMLIVRCMVVVHVLSRLGEGSKPKTI